jgi:hypothetical protein
VPGQFDRPREVRQTALMILPFVIAAAGAAAEPSSDGAPNFASALADVAKSSPAEACKSDNKADILVCGRAGTPYRIDRSVLEASREHDAAPAKPPLSADAAADNSCIGPQHCGDAVIPLVAIALTALKAAELAANGGDWRNAIRTHEDEYRLYQQAEAREAKERRVRIGIIAGGK